jgi:hypothetical protein
LANFADTKSADNKTNLMHYIATVLEEKCPDALSVSTELCSVRAAASISLAGVMEDVSAINKAGDTLSKNVLEVGLVDGDEFHEHVTTEAVAKHVLACNKLFQDGQVMQADFKSLAGMYAEDPKTATPEQFFGAILKFLDVFDKSRREVIERRRKEEKRKRDAAKKKPRKKKFDANSNLDNMLSDREKQEEIARRGEAGPMHMKDDVMAELKERRAARKKKYQPGLQEDANGGLVVIPNQTAEDEEEAEPIVVSMGDMTKVFEAEPKPPKVSIPAGLK